PHQADGILWILLHEAMSAWHFQTVNKGVLAPRRLGRLRHKGVSLIAMDNGGGHLELPYGSPKPPGERAEDFRLPAWRATQAEGAIGLRLQGMINIGRQGLFMPAFENAPLMEVVPGRLAALPAGLTLACPGC